MIDTFAYLVASNVAYAAPRARLLGSMGGIDPARIVVVVGESAGDTVIDGVRHIGVPYRAFDYTALIAFVESDGWGLPAHLFLLHDTMELGPNADRLIRQADPAHNATVAFGGQCNLGLYRADYLRRRAPFLVALKGCSKLASVESEGMLWRSLSPHERGSYGGACLEVGTAIVYGGAARMKEVYTGVDVIKYKANWGQNMHAMVTTP